MQKKLEKNFEKFHFLSIAYKETIFSERNMCPL